MKTYEKIMSEKGETSGGGKEVPAGSKKSKNVRRKGLQHTGPRGEKKKMEV